MASGTIRSVKEFCEDDSQPEVPKQRKHIDLDSISDKEFHILQAILHPVSDEQYAKVLVQFTECAEDTLLWIESFSTLWDTLAVMCPDQLERILQMTGDIRNALEEIRRTMAKEKTGGIYFKVADEERRMNERKMELAGVHNMSA